MGSQQVQEILRPTVADPRASSGVQSTSGPAKKQWANLDEFLDEAPESESDEDSESTSEGESDEAVQDNIKTTEDTSSRPRSIAGAATSGGEDEDTRSSEDDNSSSE